MRRSDVSCVSRNRTALAEAEAGVALGIGDMARAVGISPSTLRIWEAAGLSTPARDARGRRRYASGETERLREIRRLREELGLSLRDIHRLLRERNDPIANAHTGNQAGHLVAQRLRALRGTLGLTLRQVAERTGLSASYVNSVEN